jgi:cobalt-zinc-cadmium resistance protein CzcA
LKQTRSLSRYGLSQVTVIFKDGTDIYFARQLVNERIQQAKGQLPAGIEPSMGPISTGLGEIFMWTVELPGRSAQSRRHAYTPTDLREIQDWIIKPQLRNVPGVAEINTIGGYAKEFQVAPLPDKLVAYGLTLARYGAAIERNNANVGAGYIEKRGEQYLIRAPGQVSSLEDIGNIIVSSHQGVPIRISDVAEVGLARSCALVPQPRMVARSCLGTVFMLIGENSRTVSQAVAKRMEEINRTLPKGVVAQTVYDRTILVDKAIDTVKKNLLEGALLVIAILFLFLGNIRAAIITALVIPLAMLFTFTGMVSEQGQCQPDEPGCVGFWHHHRWCRGDRGELRAAACSQPTSRGRPLIDPPRALSRGVRGCQRSAPAAVVRPAHHHGGVSADLRAYRGGRKNVSPHGVHCGSCLTGCHDSIDYVHPRCRGAADRRRSQPKRKTA